MLSESAKNSGHYLTAGLNYVVQRANADRQARQQALWAQEEAQREAERKRNEDEAAHERDARDHARDRLDDHESAVEKIESQGKLHFIIGFENQCDGTAKIAIHFTALDGLAETEGWYSVKPGESVNLAGTPRSSFYYTFYVQRGSSNDVTSMKESLKTGAGAYGFNVDIAQNFDRLGNAPILLTEEDTSTLFQGVLPFQKASFPGDEVESAGYYFPIKCEQDASNN